MSIVRIVNIIALNLLGGTFTITNGDAYGSLLSTPILSPLKAVLFLVRIKRLLENPGALLLEG